MLKPHAKQALVGPQGKEYDDCTWIDLKNNIFIIADGLGAHPASEEASRLGVIAAYTYIKRDADNIRHGAISEGELLEFVKGAVDHANEVLYTLSEHLEYFYLQERSKSDKKRAGTTMDVCYIFNNHLYLAHVGDSSVYLLRDRRLTRLTSAPPVDEGKEKLKAILGESPVESFVGQRQEINVTGKEVELKDQDVILMATDGLTKLLFDEEIQEYLEAKGFEESAQQLLNGTYRPNKVPNYIKEKTDKKTFYDAVEDIVLKDSISIITIKLEEDEKSGEDEKNGKSAT